MWAGGDVGEWEVHLRRLHTNEAVEAHALVAERVPQDGVAPAEFVRDGQRGLALAVDQLDIALVERGRNGE